MGNYAHNPYGSSGNSYGKDPYGGHPVPASPHKGGGGLLGFLGNLGSDVKGAVEGLPTGIETVGGAVGRDFAHVVGQTHNPFDVPGNIISEVTNTARGKSQVGQKVVTPLAHSYAQMYGPLFHGKYGQFGHNLYAHPLGPILDALSIATLGAGGIAKAGGVLSKVGAISDTSRLANLGKVGELTVPDFGAGEDIGIKQTSSNPLIRLRQTTVNKGLNALPSETPVFGSTARGVRALTRQPERAAAALQGVAQRATKTFNQLAAPERVAFHLSARGLTPSTYLDYLAKGGEKIPAAVIKALSDPKVSQLLETPSPRLGAALAENRALSNHLTALRVAGGHLDELTALESPYRHLRIVNGATYEPETAASPALKAATAERDRIAALHEHALSQDEGLHGSPKDLRGPMTPEQAQARLAVLDKQHEALLQKIAPEINPFADAGAVKAETAARNAVRGKARRGAAVEGGGARPAQIPTVSKQLRDAAEAKLTDFVEKNPTHPVAQGQAALLAERNLLRNLLNQRGEASIAGTAEPTFPKAIEHPVVPAASNPFRNSVVQTGHALEVAQRRVDSLAGHTSQTGAVRLVDKPGRDLATLIKEQGDNQPFHIKDSAHSGGMRGRFSSRPSGYSAPLQGVKQSQGVLFSKGLINFRENAVVRDYHSFAGQARAQLIHDELVKHAAILPKGEPIPHGYEELKLNRGQASAPYTTRATEPLQHELEGQSLRSRLADLSRQSLEEANPEAPHRLIVPSQVRKLVEDNSVNHASTLRKLAYNYPTNVWKHLILGLRPAFFGNITIGNSILGTLQMAPGRWGVIGWLNQVLPGFDKIAGPRLSVETMQHVFPEQAYGTFGHSMGFSPNAGLKVAQKAWQGVMPATIGYENVLRRAMTEGWAKADPQVQAVMRRTGGDINTALPAVLKSHPQIISGISRRVDDALGNYRTYNRLERALKAVVPFYGWNRHLTSSVVRLALERPQTLDALFQTGEVGKPLADKIAGALAEYLHGSLGVNLPSWLGGVPGKQQLLSMGSLNPFNTLVDEQNMVAGAFGKPGAQSGAWPLNPIAQAAIEQLTGTDLLTGRPAKGNRFAYGLENATPLEGLVRDFVNGGRSTMTQGKHPHPATNQNNEYAQLLRYLGLPVINVNPGGPVTTGSSGGGGGSAYGYSK